MTIRSLPKQDRMISLPGPQIAWPGEVQPAGAARFWFDTVLPFWRSTVIE